MADISKLNGYTIRDDTARSQINTINNTTIPAINARIDNLDTGEKHIVENMHLVFAGDSNWGFSGSDLQNMLTYLPGCTGEDIHTGGGSWAEVYSQVTGYTGTPDVLLLNSGGNSINNNGITVSDIGGILGAPDVRDHTVPDMTQSANQTVFNYMKATFQYARDTWPRCLIYVVIRSNQPFKPRSAWYYWKFYEQQICQEWGVPVLDANNIMNLTYWNDTQKAIYNQSDGQHFTSEAYRRYLPGIAELLKSFAAVQFSQAPNNFLVPRSVINTSYTNTDVRNTQAMVRWVAEHCCPAYCAAWYVGGRVQAYMSSGTAATGRFFLQANYNDALKVDARGMVIAEDDNYFQFQIKTYSGDERNILGTCVTSRYLNTSTASPSLKTAPEGVYELGSNAVSAYKTAGEIPSAVSGVVSVTVHRVQNMSYPGESGTRIFSLITYNGSYYVGRNNNGADITWTLISGA